MAGVQIRHPRTGAEYEIQSADFKRGKHYRDPKSGELVTYEDAGFEIVANADGTEYHAPAERQPARAADAEVGSSTAAKG